MFEEEGSGPIATSPSAMPEPEQVVEDMAHAAKDAAVQAVGASEAVQAVEDVFSGEIQENFPATGDFYVQVGEFTVKKMASLLASKLEDQGYPARSYKEPAQTLWRVRIGPWSSADKAREFLPKFASQFTEATIVWATPKR